MTARDNEHQSLTSDANFAPAEGRIVPIQAQCTALQSKSSRAFLANTERDQVTVRVIPKGSDNAIQQESTS